MGILERLARDEWNLGIVHQTIDDIAIHGLRKPVRWFPRNSFQILADPFCIVNGDAITILAERLSHWVGRGEICSIVLPTGASPLHQQFEPLYAMTPHLSYPFIIQNGSERFMIMESNEAQGLFLWRCAGSQVSYVKTLMTRPAIDATVYQDQDQRWWLFCTFADDRPEERLHLFYADSLLGEWTPHPMNPVKRDRSNARPAGALFMADGKLMRPAQDSSRTYGGRLVINHVVTLTPDAYAEDVVRILEPPSDYYVDGFHTLAAAGDYTVIDGKRWHRGPISLACRVTAKVFKLYRHRQLKRFRIGEAAFSSPERRLHLRG